MPFRKSKDMKNCYRSHGCAKKAHSRAPYGAYIPMLQVTRLCQKGTRPCAWLKIKPGLWNLRTHDQCIARAIKSGVF